MFTGIITALGDVVAMEQKGALRRLTIACDYPADSIAIGASIAHAGICLTVTTLKRAGNRTHYTIDASEETLACTTMGTWGAGTRINLERALRVGDELGGHIVSGHVDGVAEVLERRDEDGAATFIIRAPEPLAKFIAEKGSVTLDGVSLTVNGVDGDTFRLVLIPHTLAVTTFGQVKAGDRLNIEIDTMARYAARLVEAGGGPPSC